MIRIKTKRKTDDKVTSRLKNKAKIRKKVAGTADRPRLAVHRSLKYISAQLIDDASGKTLASVSSKKLSFEGGGSSVAAAKAVGVEIAKLAQTKNVSEVVFDRSGYLYHGRVKAVADSARETGLKF